MMNREVILKMYYSIIMSIHWAFMIYIIIRLEKLLLCIHKVHVLHEYTNMKINILLDNTGDDTDSDTDSECSDSCPFCMQEKITINTLNIAMNTLQLAINNMNSNSINSGHGRMDRNIHEFSI